MPEVHLKQLGFTNSASGIFTKNKEIIKNFKETGYKNYIYKNELAKGYFQHDMAYGDFKDLARRIVSDKVLRTKTFNFAKDPKYERYQRGLASVIYKYYQKKSSSGSVIANIKIKQNIKLAKELHKPIIRNFKKKFIQDLKTIYEVLI